MQPDTPEVVVFATHRTGCGDRYLLNETTSTEVGSGSAQNTRASETNRHIFVEVELHGITIDQSAGSLGRVDPFIPSFEYISAEDFRRWAAANQPRAL